MRGRRRPAPGWSFSARLPSIPALSIPILVLAALLVAAPALPAWAQVQITPGALGDLGPHPEKAPPRHAAPAPTRAPTHPATAPATPPTPPQLPSLPPIPLASPPRPVLPPPLVVPQRPPRPPPPIPLSATAPGSTQPLPAGLRIIFGPDRADLNPAMVAAIRAIAGQVKPGQPVYLLAHAAGSEQDPSTPRRLSLERGLAVRAVLRHAGLPSERIYLRPLGPTDLGQASPNRVDLTLGVPPASLLEDGTSPAAPERK